LGILFPSILCTCPNQRNLFNLIVSIIVGFLILALMIFHVIINLFRYTVCCYLRHSYRWNILKFWLIRLNHGTQTIAFLEVTLWIGSSFEPILWTLWVLCIMIMLGKDKHWSTAKLNSCRTHH
jgi:hypothetical protein